MFAAVVLLAAALSAASIPRIRWRLSLVWMKVSGQFVAMSWTDVVTAAWPWNPARIDLPALLAERNPITIGWVTDANKAAGRRLFGTYCAHCHGVDAGGGTAPALTRSPLIADTRILYRTIRRGRPGTAMVGFDLPDDEVWRIIGYLGSVFTGVPAVADAERAPAFDVSSSRLVNARDEPQNWLTYSGTYDGHRHSALAEITAKNARNLKLEWIHQLAYAEDEVETTPLVIDGVMYLTEPPSNVEAIDAKTGRRIWHYQRTLPEDIRVCCGLVNRGLAALGDRVYLATLDAHLVTLEAATGKVISDIVVADYRDGYTMNLAPLAIGDKVIVGVSGNDSGLRGFIDAYDASTSKRLWRFWTVPEPGEPGHDTWAGDSWRKGGAPAWLTGSYDPVLNLLYWGTGNPWPVNDGQTREGDNLYSDSVVALSPDSGKLVWHYQFTPHDLWDRDANQIPVLVDDVYKGRPRHLLLLANRNGFYYVLDRQTGQFLSARAFATQNWADGIDDTGRPRRRSSADPSITGSLVSPGPMGATNWWSPTFDPGLKRFFVATIPSSSATYYSGIDDHESHGVFGVGVPSGDDGVGPPAIRALDAYTGVQRWEYTFADRVPDGAGGLLSTAGGVVFGGAMETFVALDATTGAELWRFGTGGVIRGAPISYALDGKQRVTVAAGRSILTFSLETK
jgi:alcohol dehydrogenase (cytochrome c)